MLALARVLKPIADSGDAWDANPLAAWPPERRGRFAERCPAGRKTRGPAHDVRRSSLCSRMIARIRVRPVAPGRSGSDCGLAGCGEGSEARLTSREPAAMPPRNTKGPCTRAGGNVVRLSHCSHPRPWCREVHRDVRAIWSPSGHPNAGATDILQLVEPLCARKSHVMNKQRVAREWLIALGAMTFGVTVWPVAAFPVLFSLRPTLGVVARFLQRPSWRAAVGAGLVHRSGTIHRHSIGSFRNMGNQDSPKGRLEAGEHRSGDSRLPSGLVTPRPRQRRRTASRTASRFGSRAAFSGPSEGWRMTRKAQ